MAVGSVTWGTKGILNERHERLCCVQQGVSLGKQGVKAEVPGRLLMATVPAGQDAQAAETSSCKGEDVKSCRVLRD